MFCEECGTPVVNIQQPPPETIPPPVQPKAVIQPEPAVQPPPVQSKTTAQTPPPENNQAGKTDKFTDKIVDKFPILTEYVNMLKNFSNFSDRTTFKGFWMACLVDFIFSLVLMLIPPLATLYTFVTIIPALAISVRRLRDAGKTWHYMLWLLIPIPGWIILIYSLCRPSVEDNGTRVV